MDIAVQSSPRRVELQREGCFLGHSWQLYDFELPRASHEVKTLQLGSENPVTVRGLTIGKSSGFLLKKPSADALVLENLNTALATVAAHTRLPLWQSHLPTEITIVDSLGVFNNPSEQIRALPYKIEGCAQTGIYVDRDIASNAKKFEDLLTAYLERSVYSAYTTYVVDGPYSPHSEELQAHVSADLRSENLIPITLFLDSALLPPPGSAGFYPWAGQNCLIVCNPLQRRPLYFDSSRALPAEIYKPDTLQQVLAHKRDRGLECFYELVYQRLRGASGDVLSTPSSLLSVPSPSMSYAQLNSARENLTGTLQRVHQIVREFMPYFEQADHKFDAEALYEERRHGIACIPLSRFIKIMPESDACADSNHQALVVTTVIDALRSEGLLVPAAKTTIYQTTLKGFGSHAFNVTESLNQPAIVVDCAKNYCGPQISRDVIKGVFEEGALRRIGKERWIYMTVFQLEQLKFVPL